MSRSRALVTVGLTLLIALAILRLKNRLVSTLEAHGHLRPSMAGRLRLLGRWIVLATLLLVILQQLGIFDHAWAVASAALAAVAVGVVAMWSILSHALAALLILVYRPFRIGDDIELLEITNPLGMRGRVVDMNLMFTVIQQADGKGDGVHLLHIPNNLVFQKLVRVYSTAEVGTRASFFGDTEPSDVQAHETTPSPTPVPKPTASERVP